MKMKPLTETNPYLKDPVRREELVARAVKTSGGVKGIKTVGDSKSGHIEIPRRGGKKIYAFVKQTASTK
ncbi:MAG: hypothetical protein K0Q74_175 [Gammaproteobacteria bacterium]|nr:hypothetical protein [Gammaproteobacteria bacterium]